jgi:hypothetical protein
MSEPDDLRIKLQRIAADDSDPDAQEWAQGLLEAPREPTGSERLNAEIRQAAAGTRASDLRERLRRGL